MAPILVLVHTLHPLLGVFTALAGKIIPDVRLMHILDEPLLETIRRRASLTEQDEQRLAEHVAAAERIGAAAVLVTCSTVSPCVDTVHQRSHLPIFKIDEAMISAAVQQGRNIGVVATNPTTLEPTRRLLYEQAMAHGKSIQTELLLVDNALAALLAGDATRHDLLVKAAVLDLARRTDVVVLAQASMARVLDIITEAERPVPILSSPPLALAQVKAYLQAHVGGNPPSVCHCERSEAIPSTESAQ